MKKFASNLKTGWFGVPGTYAYNAKVHVVDRKGKPICGSKMGKESLFQFCSYGIWFDKIECQHCRRVSAKLLNEQKG